MSECLHRLYARARLDDRQVNELIGLAHGLTADGSISQTEAEHLRKWLVANVELTDNPVIAVLLKRVHDMLVDGALDAEEQRELLEVLTSFSGGDFELGELAKASTLPLDRPPPAISFDDTRFCFTGTFAYGSRRECEAAVANMGASCGPINAKTDYLVIGIYATDSWAHSSFGRKIEKALHLKRKGNAISIVGEPHWISFLNA